MVETEKWKKKAAELDTEFAEPEKMQYKDSVLAAKKKWDEMSPELKEAREAGRAELARVFLCMFDTVKRIEKTYNICVMDIAKEEWWNSMFKLGESLAKLTKKHGIKDLYDVIASGWEGYQKVKWFELSDKGLHCWLRNCTFIDYFRALGKTDEEIKDIASLFCYGDQGLELGFNPKLEVQHDARLMMKGDPHCTILIDDHGDESGEWRERF